MDRERILEEMRATSIPEGESGLWSVRRHSFARPLIEDGKSFRHIDPGTYTGLYRWTDATMNQDGDCVMIDHRPELNTHLEVIHRAAGRVLVSGLGLGCVARGLLCNSSVDHVDVVELDRHVLDLVEPHMPSDDRLHIHHADIIDFHDKGPWDYAWHDLWLDDSALKLHTLHVQIMHDFESQVRHWQGAWAMPRCIRRQLANYR